MTHRDTRFKNVCRDWMKGSCSHSPCRFIHDPELCVEFYSTLKCDGLCGKNHFVNKYLIKSTSKHNSNKRSEKHDNRPRRPANTEKKVCLIE